MPSFGPEPPHLLSKNIKTDTHRTIILSAFFNTDVKHGLSHCGRDTSLRVFENRMLGKTFGLMKHKVIDGSIKPHNEELQNLSSSSNVIQVIKMMKRDGKAT